MDFTVGYPRSQQSHDAIWVIVDRLTKSAHFIAYDMTYTVEKMSRLYLQQVVRLHGIPITIVSDRDSRFTVGFWENWLGNGDVVEEEFGFPPTNRWKDGTD